MTINSPCRYGDSSTKRQTRKVPLRMEQILPGKNMVEVTGVLSQGGQWPTALSAGDHARVFTAQH